MLKNSYKYVSTTLDNESRDAIKSNGFRWSQVLNGFDNIRISKQILQLKLQKKTKEWGRQQDKNFCTLIENAFNIHQQHQ
jgi:hypothetical protein